MEGNNVSSDHVIAELVEMGFEFSLVMEAIGAVGLSLDAAVDYLVNASNRKNFSSSGGMSGLNNDACVLGKRVASSRSLSKMKQPTIIKHLQPSHRIKRTKTCDSSIASISGSKMPMPLEAKKVPCIDGDGIVRQQMRQSSNLANCAQDKDLGLDWEGKVVNLLQKHFGFSSLKSFQKEAFAAWSANQDCLVLAATGSGKSLCFQIPALLTGKVVVVISPLISLMHDQCLKLAQHGISACFLGSGQTDSSVEHKAMNGMYSIVYVCPETVLRLIEPLQKLAENRGIALFAIDEVHCVSKWGHDFRSDYRRLYVLRENFKACNLKFLSSDIPLMALTATATIRVREDILDSLKMSKDTMIVLTSFFRSNLRFSVKHSITSSPSSYEKDFSGLIDSYAKNKLSNKKEHCSISYGSDDEYDSDSSLNEDGMPLSNERKVGDFDSNGNDAEINSADENGVGTSEERQLTVEYLEDELDCIKNVDDFDVVCGDFFGHSSTENKGTCEPSKADNLPVKLEETVSLHGTLEEGPTIIYVPTRKETLTLSKFLCQRGVRAAAYNAKLPKVHLRQVHSEFHQNTLQVVVATIAFGMGIDKSNVRRIIHYGWPQSLESYYQEAGRAGRDGKLADCILYANLMRIPTLLPSKRSEEQTKVAYKMLSDCFRYGMGTASCRAKTLVEYFGEDFTQKCLLCDVCEAGPPELQNVNEEVNVFLQAVYKAGLCENAIYGGKERPNFRMIVNCIREEFPRFASSDRLWWQGLARILEDKGYLREGHNVRHVCIKFPELTSRGLKFLESDGEENFYVYPEADMLLPTKSQKSFSTLSEWGKGWADPVIRRQRLQGRKHKRRKQRSGRHKHTLKTVRGRLEAKLSKRSC
ncbi:hypothetical protein Sjap_007517 [Stephania japonica]|uniref:ATP-dependent DNA helicase n=1 Tax=Stephania japonica TaxID=461633 RepID=A0AAP0JPG3_9MAGN